MSVPLSSSAFESYSIYDEDDLYPTEFELDAGERIGGPATRANDVLAWCTSFAIIVGGAWVMTHDDGALLTRLPDLAARVSNSIVSFMPAAAVPNETPLSRPLVSTPVGPPQAAAAPIPLPEPTAIPEAPTIKSEPMETSGPGAASETDTAAPDSYRARAEAAGLNPDISRSLLMRFSANDFRNARIAIDRAVAKTPDGGVFVWPRQRKPKDALFQVKFVEGAGPDCRRYVVTVTMDNWTTTASPMEKCGVPKIAASATVSANMKKRAEP
jgi:hypothetical protein